MECETGPHPANQQFLQISLNATRNARPPLEAFALKMEKAFLLSTPGANQVAAYFGTSNFLSVVDLSMIISVFAGGTMDAAECVIGDFLSFWARWRFG